MYVCMCRVIRVIRGIMNHNAHIVLCVPRAACLSVMTGIGHLGMIQMYNTLCSLLNTTIYYLILL